MHNEERLDMVYSVAPLPARLLVEQVPDENIAPIMCVVRLGTLAGAVEMYPRLAHYWTIRLEQKGQ